jgi:hypothetical protein
MGMISDMDEAGKSRGAVHTSYCGLLVLLEIIIDKPKYK